MDNDPECKYCKHLKSVHTGYHDEWVMADDYQGDDFIQYYDICEADGCHCGGFH